jgi:hypothetical protein
VYVDASDKCEDDNKTESPLTASLLIDLSRRGRARQGFSDVSTLRTEIPASYISIGDPSTGLSRRR